MGKSRKRRHQSSAVDAEHHDGQMARKRGKSSSQTPAQPDASSRHGYKLTLARILEELIDLQAKPKHFYANQFLEALVHLAEKVKPSEWRKLFTECSESCFKKSEVWGTFLGKYRSSCEAAVEQNGTL